MNTALHNTEELRPVKTDPNSVYTQGTHWSVQMYLTPFKTAWGEGQSCVSRPQCAVQCYNSVWQAVLIWIQASVPLHQWLTQIYRGLPRSYATDTQPKSVREKGRYYRGHNPVPLDLPGNQGQRLSERTQNELVFGIYLGCITISKSQRQSLNDCCFVGLCVLLKPTVQLMHFLKECDIAN